MNNFNFQIPDTFVKQQKEIEESAKKAYQQKQEQLQRDKENTLHLKDITELKEIIKESNKSNGILSTRMYYLTIATVLLAIVQVFVAIIQLFYR